MEVTPEKESVSSVNSRSFRWSRCNRANSSGQTAKSLADHRAPAFPEPVGNPCRASSSWSEEFR